MKLLTKYCLAHLIKKKSQIFCIQMLILKKIIKENEIINSINYFQTRFTNQNVYINVFSLIFFLYLKRLFCTMH